MSAEKYLNYRGTIAGLAASGGTVAFVTRHPEGHATGLYRRDADALTLDEDARRRGGVAVVADGESVWVAGGDGRVYEGSLAGADPRALAATFASPPTALAPLADD